MALTDPPSQRSRCSSCGAPIIWVRTPAGRPTPVNADSGVELQRDGKVHVVATRTGYHAVKVTAYTSHFATCPQAARWRQQPKKGPPK
jgi:hypothetical protein